MCRAILLLSAILTILVRLLVLGLLGHDFLCVEKNYNYLSCHWNATDNISCWLLTNPLLLNSSIGICEIQRRGNKLICNVSQQFYLSLDDNEFTLHNVCMNTSESHQFSTKTDENVQINPVTHIEPSWTSPTEVNFTWSLPVYPCMVNEFNGGINCTVAVFVETAIVSTTLESNTIKSHNPERQEKWTAVNRQESSCRELPSVSLIFQHLRPLTMYTAEIKCRPFGSQYWSEPARCSFITTISKPQNSPWTGPGSYVLYRCGSSLCFTLYWRYTHYHSEVISGYTVNISQSSLTESITVNRTMATILNLPAVSRFTVNVLARNSAGNSPPLTLQIKPQTAEQRAPACVTTVHVGGFTYEVVFSSSEEGPHVDLVIYYWCQGVKHGEFVDCKGFLEWKKVPIANVTRSDDAFRYNITTDYADNTQFAVVLQDDGGTSDMVWGTTAYRTREGSDAPSSSSVAETVVAGTVSVLVLLIVISIAIFKLCDRGSPSIKIELPVISSTEENAKSASYNVEDISND